MEKSLLITPEKPALVLRICNPDGGSHNNFKWPMKGPVSCPDWEESKSCGHGLHGWLNGEGSSSAANSFLFHMRDAIWMVVEVPAYVDLDGKVKFPSGNVIFSGNQKEATQYLEDNGCQGAIIGHAIIKNKNEVVVVGDRGTAISGKFGNVTVGHRAKAVVGKYGNATAGDYSTVVINDFCVGNVNRQSSITGGHHCIAIGQYMSEAKVGDYSTATVGSHGTAIAGNHGIATAGNWGKAVAGNEGTANTGFNGIAIAGIQGTATAGERGRATAGERGTAIVEGQGTASVGDHGVAITGERGAAKAGIDGEIRVYPNPAKVIQRKDITDSNTKIFNADSKIKDITYSNTKIFNAIAHIKGLIGIDLDFEGNVLKPHVLYRLDKENKFVEFDLEKMVL